MPEYEYEVRFLYDTIYIGTVVYVDELVHSKAIDAAVYQVWESNGIDIDVDDCVHISCTVTGMIGGN